MRKRKRRGRRRREEGGRRRLNRPGREKSSDFEREESLDVISVAATGFPIRGEMNLLSSSQSLHKGLFTRFYRIVISTLWVSSGFYVLLSLLVLLKYFLVILQSGHVKPDTIES